MNLMAAAAYKPDVYEGVKARRIRKRSVDARHIRAYVRGLKEGKVGRERSRGVNWKSQLTSRRIFRALRKAGVYESPKSETLGEPV